MLKRLDIIVLGATGLTGKHCIGELYRLTKDRFLTWGIAGRNEVKLKECLRTYEKQSNCDLTSIPVLLTDINDSESLKRTTASARVIINCCGPYRFYGDQVVKACLDTSTHHIDVTGEPEYMETMHFKYNQIAQERCVYIVQACGMDSIPSDLGVVYLQKKFGGTVNSIETYLKLSEKNANIRGPVFNYATWESLVHSLSSFQNLVNLRKQTKSKPLPLLSPKLKAKSTIHKIEPLNSWAVPFMGADRSVIQRSQRYFYENYNKRPIQIQTYQQIQTLLGLIKFVIFGKIFTFMIKYNCGQQLLLKYPDIFSMGSFSHNAPSEEKTKNSQFTLTLFGKGWYQGKSVESNPEKQMIIQLSGENVVYGLTATMATLSAIVILTESDKLPPSGGVYTPGVAFSETSLIEMLQENGLSIEIKSNL